jgi:hypothetical protein
MTNKDQSQDHVLDQPIILVASQKQPEFPVPTTRHNLQNPNMAIYVDEEEEKQPNKVEKVPPPLPPKPQVKNNKMESNLINNYLKN